MARPSKDKVSNQARRMPKGVGGLAVYLAALGGRTSAQPRVSFWEARATREQDAIARHNAGVRATMAMKREPKIPLRQHLAEAGTLLRDLFRRPAAVQTLPVAPVAPAPVARTVADMEADAAEARALMLASQRRRAEHQRFADLAVEVEKDRAHTQARVTRVLDMAAAEEMTAPSRARRGYSPERERMETAALDILDQADRRGGR